MCPYTDKGWTRDLVKTTYPCGRLLDGLRTLRWTRVPVLPSLAGGTVPFARKAPRISVPSLRASSPSSCVGNKNKLDFFTKNSNFIASDIKRTEKWNFNFLFELTFQWLFLENSTIIIYLKKKVFAFKECFFNKIFIYFYSLFKVTSSVLYWCTHGDRRIIRKWASGPLCTSSCNASSRCSSASATSWMVGVFRAPSLSCQKL